MGTPDFAVPTLARIAADGHAVAAVYTRAPARAGRGMSLKPSPVHGLADSLGVPVLTPETLKGEDAAETFRRHGDDVAVVVAYELVQRNALRAWASVRVTASGSGASVIARTTATRLAPASMTAVPK